MVVGGYLAQAEQRLAVGPAVAFAQLALIREEGGALHEEDRERRHADIGDRIGRVDPPALVGEACAALAQVTEEGFEALHMDLESETGPPENPLSGRP